MTVAQTWGLDSIASVHTHDPFALGRPDAVCPLPKIGRIKGAIHYHV